MSDSRKTRRTRVLALVFLVLCCALLCGTVFMRQISARFRVEDVRLAPRLSLTTPGVDCVVEGTNPLPFGLTVSDITFTLLNDRLGAEVQAVLPDERSIPSGRFRMVLSLPDSLSALRLGLHRPGGNDSTAVEYRIEMSVGVLWFKKSVEKAGPLDEVVQSSIEGAADGG